MGKKIFFSVSLIFLCVIGGMILFLGKDESMQEEKGMNDVIVEKNEQIEDDKKKIEVEETEKKEIIDEVNDESSMQKEVIQKNSQEKKSNIPKDESKQSVITEQNEKQNQIQNEQKESTTVVPKEEQIPPVDEELERLKKQVEYATYEECQKAGFEKAFSDTVNILGFSCQEVIYKGQILGYKLHIDYTNPME